MKVVTVSTEDVQCALCGNVIPVGDIAAVCKELPPSHTDCVLAMLLGTTVGLAQYELTPPSPANFMAS